MKILVFTDVHGCFNSLCALEKTDDFKNADKIVFLGDVLFGYSRPNECIEFLRKNNCHCLIGNNDAYVCCGATSGQLKEMQEQKKQQMQWFKEHISDENKSIVRKWDKYLQLTVDNKKFCFAHFDWVDIDNEQRMSKICTKRDLEARKKMFKQFDAQYYFFGHEHNYNFFANDQKQYYSVGSLGITNPGSYLLIDCNNNDVSIQQKFVDFDIDFEIDLLNKAGYPYDKSRLKKF